MEEEKITSAGSFCWNEACADYGQVGKGNIIKNGKTDKGVQRYRCQTCKQTFTETKGTLFYRCRHSQEQIVECLAMVGDRTSLAAIHRMKGIKEETVGRWMERAATQVEQVEEQLVGPKKLSRVQLDAPLDLCRTQGRKRGQPEEEARGTFWRGTAIDMDTRLRVGRAIAKTEEEVAPQLMQQIKRHAPEDSPPAMSTDGKGAYREAMLATWGTVPQYGGRGRPPTVPQPGKDWQYLQVIRETGGKQGHQCDHQGDLWRSGRGEKGAWRTDGLCGTNPFDWHEQMNGRLVRKTLSFSKELRFLKAASALEDGLYNFTRPRKHVTD